jgi:hypothetical protein
VEKKAKGETISDGDAINCIINDQNQSSTATSNNDENANKSTDDKLKEMEKVFQVKINLIQQQNEGNNNSLQKELASLKQKELDQQEENRQLKERLAKMEAGIQDNAYNGLNHDSSNDKKDDRNDINYNSECSNSEEDVDDINDTTKMNVTEGNDNDLQDGCTALQLESQHEYKEEQILQERLRKMEAGVQDDTDLSYHSSDEELDDENDINYDSEYSNSEEEVDDINNTAKMNVTEGNDDDLQNGCTDLRQESQHEYKENQLVKERLARMEEAMQNNADNDLNYDSSDSESNDNIATNNVGVERKDDDALQKERAALKQQELEQHEENQLLRERLARIVAVQDDPHNEPYYNSSDNEEDDKNDNWYNTKRSNGDKKKEDGSNTITITQKRESHYHLVEIYADPNYDSSDNEDPRNDIYLD